MNERIIGGYNVRHILPDSVIFQLVRAALEDQPINLPNINNSMAPSRRPVAAQSPPGRRDPSAHGGHVMDRKIHPVNTHTSLKLMGNSLFCPFSEKTGIPDGGAPLSLSDNA